MSKALLMITHRPFRRLSSQILLAQSIPKSHGRQRCGDPCLIKKFGSHPTDNQSPLCGSDEMLRIYADSNNRT